MSDRMSMRYLMVLVAVCLWGTRALAADVPFDWDIWRALPVQNGGRQKPLDTLGWESLRLIANRSSLVDPDTAERLNPTAVHLAMMFDWQGWDHPDRGQLELLVDWRPLYFHLHAADKWDRMPFFAVDHVALRSALGLKDGEKAMSARQLSESKIKDRDGGREIPFSTWAEKLLAAEQADEVLAEHERAGLALANRFWSYQHLRMGRSFEILPLAANDEQKWMTIAQLLLMKSTPESDPTRELQKAQASFVLARKSYLARDGAAFNRASAEFVAIVQRVGATSATRESYPRRNTMMLEVTYNRWAPFRIGWILMLASTLGMLLFWGSGSNRFFVAGFVAYVLGLMAVLIGFAMRIAIAARPPVTNMYESVLYVGAGVAVLGLVFECLYGKKYILSAAASVATLAFVLADNCPLVLDPSLRPLEPVLRSNFWLVTHVMTITLSYAALALALGLGNITLGHICFGSNNASAITSLSRFTYKAIQVGVLLLSAGVILGGVWADYSWGRFWGWDPKEVWALIALLGYLAVLHARYAGWVGHRGLAALSVTCFSLVVMAWYGVNFVLGTGLHSYGFGGGGKGWVYSAVVLQLLFVAIALLRSETRDAGQADNLPSMA